MPGQGNRFVAPCGGRAQRGQCHCRASGGLPSTRRASSHFTHLPYATGALPAAAMGGAYVLSPCRPFKQRNSGSFFHHPNPHWILQPEVMRASLPGAGTLGCMVWPGAGIAGPQAIPPDFYPPRVNVGPSIPLPPEPPLCTTWLLCPVSATPPLPPIWMNVASLNPWLSVPYSLIFCQFWVLFVLRLVVILLVVV